MWERERNVCNRKETDKLILYNVFKNNNGVKKNYQAYVHIWNCVYEQRNG